LRRRLAWGLTLTLQPFDDADKLAAFIRRTSNLGFELSPRAGLYLLRRRARDLPGLWKLLEDLDQATISSQRRLTSPFLKAYLDEMP
jgi:DnaA family protein